MRQYTLVFMEQRMGASRPSRIEGEQGAAFFTAEDDEAALAVIAERYTGRLADCVRAELSSMYIMTDPTARDGVRLVDDYHALPYSQTLYVTYDAVTQTVECDWDSTRTGLLAAGSVLR